MGRRLRIALALYVVAVAGCLPPVAPAAPGENFVVPEHLCGPFAVWVKMFAQVRDPDAHFDRMTTNATDQQIAAYAKAHQFAFELDGNPDEKEVKARVMCVLANRNFSPSEIVDI